MPKPSIVFERVSAIHDKDARRVLRAVVCGDPWKITVDDKDDIGSGEVRGVRAWGEEGDADVVGVWEGDVDSVGAGGEDRDGEEAGESGESGDRVGVSAEEGGDDERWTGGKDGRADSGCGWSRWLRKRRLKGKKLQAYLSGIRRWARWGAICEVGPEILRGILVLLAP
jgi:hypothetical protein